MLQAAALGLQEKRFRSLEKRGALSQLGQLLGLDNLEIMCVLFGTLYRTHAIGLCLASSSIRFLDLARHWRCRIPPSRCSHVCLTCLYLVAKQ